MDFKVPILELGKTLITAIQFDLSDEQVVQFQRDVVTSINNKEADGIIIDISALDVVDSYMARAINDTARAAKLIGAEVVVCGIQPFVAMTLVEMGRNLFNVVTTFNLEQALTKINELLAQRS